MKRISSLALLALGLVLAMQQQASAWSKFNFGVGLNVGFDGGGNSVLWGVMKGAPSPGSTDGYPGFQGGQGPGGYGSAGGEGNSYANYPYGRGLPMTAMPASSGVPAQQPMPQGCAIQQMPCADAQAVGYTYPTYPYYNANYSYPYYNNGWYYGNWYGY